MSKTPKTPLFRLDQTPFDGWPSYRRLAIGAGPLMLMLAARTLSPGSGLFAPALQWTLRTYGVALMAAVFVIAARAACAHLPRQEPRR